MATTSYTIINSQGNLRFQINVGSASGPYERYQQDADLTFYGYGRTGWGQEVDQNFYRLLENFAVGEKTASPATPKNRSDLSPSGGLGVNKPIIGQSWFNLTTNEMYVCDDPTTNSWRHLISEQYADSRYLGAGTASTFVAKAGDTMTGYLTLNANPRTGHPLDAVTKQYADSLLAGSIDDLTTLIGNTYVRKSGDTMTGTLWVREGTSTAFNMLTIGTEVGTNVKYPALSMGNQSGTACFTTLDFYTSGDTVKDSGIIASGGTNGVANAGSLTLYGNIFNDGRWPSNPSHLVNKSWVDNAISYSITILANNVSTYYATYAWVNARAYMPAGWGGSHQVWVSWYGPSGGADGDIWFQL